MKGVSSRLFPALALLALLAVACAGRSPQRVDAISPKPPPPKSETCACNAAALHIPGTPGMRRVESNARVCNFVSSDAVHPVSVFDASLVVEFACIANLEVEDRDEEAWAKRRLIDGVVAERGSSSILGRPTNWYVIEGQWSDARETADWSALVARVIDAARVVVLVAYFPQGEERSRALALAMFTSVTE